MARAEWTQEAEQDLEEITLYIAVQAGRRDTARKIYFEIKQKCQLYAKQPMLGSPIPDLGDSYRSFIHKRWLIIYRPQDSGLEVLAVLDSSRDYAEFFRQRSQGS